MYSVVARLGIPLVEWGARDERQLFMDSAELNAGQISLGSFGSHMVAGSLG